jgi:hypothetical protein
MNMQRHRFDPVSFVFGLIFVGFAATAAFADEDIEFLEARWIWPAVLIVAGLFIVGFSLGRKPQTDESEPAPHNPVD